MAAAPKQISLYSLSDLKSTLDDHLPVFLSSANTPSGQPLPRAQRFKPNHFLTNVRLALGYTAVSIAGYIFYLDYVAKKPFTETKQLTLFAVIAYFALNSALTLWMWFAERGIVFAGERDNLLLKIRSYPAHKKYDPVYRINAGWQGSGASGSKELQVEFMKFFSQDGYFVAQEFETWLRNELPVIVGGGEETKKGR